LFSTWLLQQHPLFSVMLVALSKTPPPDGKEQFAWGLGVIASSACLVSLLM
jgi:hypothetical protein